MKSMAKYRNAQMKKERNNEGGKEKKEKEEEKREKREKSLLLFPGVDRISWGWLRHFRGVGP
jgi:hypothetical protein